jgi:hypothetical protein
MVVDSATHGSQHRKKIALHLSLSKPCQSNLTQYLEQQKSFIVEILEVLIIAIS